MDVTATLDAACSTDRLRMWVSELDRYPAWLSIVPRADLEPAPSAPADDASGAPGGGPEGSGDGDDIGQPAWAVELRAKVGPLARSKRLRMVRTLDEELHVRFERWEIDGKDHSPWVLDARIEAIQTGSRLTMRLHYGGNLGAGLLERLLTDEIESSKPRLLALVEDDVPRP